MQMHSIYTAVVAATGGFSGVAPVLAAAVQASGTALAGMAVEKISAEFSRLAGDAASFPQVAEALHDLPAMVAPATPVNTPTSKGRDR